MKKLKLLLLSAISTLIFSCVNEENAVFESIPTEQLQETLSFEALPGHIKTSFLESEISFKKTKDVDLIN